jgi:hypothetical protein
MTPSPKEKAKELYNKYLPLVQGGHLNETYHNKAKQCAIIAANEAEQAEYNVLIKFNLVTKTYKSKYWEEVKQELEKL